jgi:DNA-directed RNA polymerase subunit beta'
MLLKVRVEDPGETDVLPGATVDKFTFRRINQQAQADGKKPATAKPLLLGLTKASLQSDSFIAAASFQETTKVLTEAALSGRVDHLLGLKENVILGHLIPAGTAFRAYNTLEIRKHGVEPAPPELAHIGDPVIDDTADEPADAESVPASDKEQEPD